MDGILLHIHLRQWQKISYSTSREKDIWDLLLFPLPFAWKINFSLYTGIEITRAHPQLVKIGNHAHTLKMALCWYRINGAPSALLPINTIHAQSDFFLTKEDTTCNSKRSMWHITGLNVRSLRIWVQGYRWECLNDIRPVRCQRLPVMAAVQWHHPCLAQTGGRLCPDWKRSCLPLTCLDQGLVAGHHGCGRNRKGRTK